MKYRKKPIVIDAWPVDDLLKTAKKSWRDLPLVVRLAYEKGDVVFLEQGIDVRTLEGWMLGDPSYFLIAGVQSELYAIKPNIFAATYDPVDE